MRPPSFQFERELLAQGHALVVGVDEAGCGCLAGPVIAAAVHLPFSVRIAAITDSKLLTTRKREEVFEQLLRHRLSFTVGMASVSEIDQLNIRRAGLLAMRRAIEAFEGATFALIDAWTVPGLRIGQKGIIHGDRLVKSIAAASIIAKVVRDRLMEEYDKDFPGYGIARHKGYATVLHRQFLQKLGPSELHRRSFLKNFKF